MKYDSGFLERALKSMMAAAGDACWLLDKAFGKTLDISSKGPRDIVTDADVAAEKAIFARLSADFPDIARLAEESGGTIPKEGLLWIVDPLDGTTNFAHGYTSFCVSIALTEPAGNDAGFEPLVGVVASPLTGDLFWAIKGKGAFLNAKRLDVSEGKRPALPIVLSGLHYEKGPELQECLDIVGKVLPKVQAVLRSSGSSALNICAVGQGIVDCYWEFGMKSWDVAAGLLIVREAGGWADFFRDDGKRRSLILAGSQPIVQGVADVLISVEPRLKKHLPLDTGHVRVTH